MTKHVVMWSSGITSWAVARQIVAMHGHDDTVLLFADTLVEDPDNYRFNREASAQLGMDLTVVCDGRTPQQVNIDTRWLSNARTAKCSELLKIKPSRAWLDDHCDPSDTVLYVGLDWTEPERVDVNRRLWTPWRVEFPLTTPPYYTKDHWLAESRRLGIEPPEMYTLGFAHANCGGACVRGGQAQWAHLLDVRPRNSRFDPQRFANAFRSWEEHEKFMNGFLVRGDDPVAIVRDRRGGETKPLPLTVIRQRHESQPSLLDLDDWGGCGCFTEPAVTDPSEPGD